MFANNFFVFSGKCVQLTGHDQVNDLFPPKKADQASDDKVWAIGNGAILSPYFFDNSNNAPEEWR